MAIAWFSPSPRRHQPKQSNDEAEARLQKEDEDEDEDDENVQQLEQCARLYKCLEGLGLQTHLHWEFPTSVHYITFAVTQALINHGEEFYMTQKDCLVKTDRNWRACQTEVKALKECHDAKSKNQTSSPASVDKSRPRTSH